MPRAADGSCCVLAHHLAIDHATLECWSAEVQLISQGRAAELPAAGAVPQLRGAGAPRRIAARSTKHSSGGCWRTSRSRRRRSGCWTCRVTAARSTEARADAGAGAGAARAGAGAAAGSERGELVPRWPGRWCWRAQRAATTWCSGRCCSGGCRAARARSAMLGMFINTLPLRSASASRASPQRCAQTHGELAELCATSRRRWRWRSAAAASPAQRRCSSALLNYRHTAAVAVQAAVATGGAPLDRGCLGGEERTNYPLTLSVDDLGEGFVLTAQVSAAGRRAARVRAHAKRRCESLVEALRGAAPRPPSWTLESCPRRSGGRWWRNGTRRAAAVSRRMHASTSCSRGRWSEAPDAVAVVCGEERR